MTNVTNTAEDLAKLQERLNSLQARELAEMAWIRLKSQVLIATLAALISLTGLGSYAFSEAKHSIESQFKPTLEEATKEVSKAKVLSELAGREVQNATDKAVAAAHKADELTREMEDRVARLQAQVYTLEKLSAKLGQTLAGALQATDQAKISKDQQAQFEEAVKTAIATTKALDKSKKTIRIIYKSNTRHADADVMKEQLAELGFSAVVIGSNLSEVKPRKAGTVVVFGGRNEGDLLKELGDALNVPPLLRVPDKELPDDAQIILY